MMPSKSKFGSGEVFRDPSVKKKEAWRVRWNGIVLSPVFDSKEPAESYLTELLWGKTGTGR